MLNAIRILTMAIGLALMMAGAYVVFEGGLSHTPPIHVNVGCTLLGLGMVAVGALLALLPSWFGRPSRASA
jgi:hypothetical protein